MPRDDAEQIRSRKDFFMKGFRHIRMARFRPSRPPFDLPMLIMRRIPIRMGDAPADGPSGHPQRNMAAQQYRQPCLHLLTPEIQLLWQNFIDGRVHHDDVDSIDDDVVAQRVAALVKRLERLFRPFPPQFHFRARLAFVMPVMVAGNIGERRIQRLDFLQNRLHAFGRRKTDHVAQHENQIVFRIFHSGSGFFKIGDGLMEILRHPLAVLFVRLPAFVVNGQMGIRQNKQSDGFLQAKPLQAKFVSIQCKRRFIRRLRRFFSGEKPCFRQHGHHSRDAASHF